jgi:hypothetical protein
MLNYKMKDAVKLNFKEHAKLWRDLVQDWDSFCKRKENIAELETWCKEATGGNDVYSFLDILCSQQVADYYNSHRDEIKNLEKESGKPRITLNNEHEQQLKEINQNDCNLGELKRRADNIINHMPDGLTDIEKASYIWQQIMQVDYDMRGYTGGANVPVQDTRFFKNNKTVCGTMSALVKMVCMSPKVNIPCEVIETNSKVHALNAVQIDGKWSIMDWTYAKLKANALKHNLTLGPNDIKSSGMSKASLPNDFFLTSVEQYNSYQPGGNNISGFNTSTEKVPSSIIVSAMSKVKPKIVINNKNDKPVNEGGTTL